jgi:hypothetical protein
MTGSTELAVLATHSDWPWTWVVGIAIGTIAGVARLLVRRPAKRSPLRAPRRVFAPREAGRAARDALAGRGGPPPFAAHAVVEFTLLGPEGGGRALPARAVAFEPLFAFAGEHFRCRVDLSGCGPLAAGTPIRAPLRFSAPKLIVRRLSPGVRFEFVEVRVVGAGAVIELL